MQAKANATAAHWYRVKRGKGSFSTRHAIIRAKSHAPVQMIKNMNLEKVMFEYPENPANSGKSKSIMLIYMFVMRVGSESAFLIEIIS